MSDFHSYLDPARAATLLRLIPYFLLRLIPYYDRRLITIDALTSYLDPARAATLLRLIARGRTLLR